MPTWITGIYLLFTIFGVGVTAMEMLGLLGSWGEDLAGADGATAAEAGGERGSAGLPAAEVEERGTGGRLAHLLFGLLWYLRLLVYFALGFGLVGLVALLADSGAWWSLAWAVPAGLVTLGVARAFFHFQQKEVDSTVGQSDLVGRPAEVIISIEPGEIGKVRIQLEQLVRDRYARAADPSARVAKGQKVVVDRVTEECVYVTAEEERADDQGRSRSAANDGSEPTG